MEDYRKNVQRFRTGDELVENLAEKICDHLTEAIDVRKKAAIVVSGGSTPKPLFKQLALKDISWHQVTITLADERWVDTSLPESNENLVRTYLLRQKAAKANFIGLKNHFPTAAEGEQVCHETLNRIPRPFDVVVLGMGSDGHTASLFPRSPVLEKALDIHCRANCLAVPRHGSSCDRMTLTLPVLLASRRIFIHIAGREKMTSLEQAMAEGPVADKPIRAILGQDKTPVQIFWAP